MLSKFLCIVFITDARREKNGLLYLIISSAENVTSYIKLPADDILVFFPFFFFFFLRKKIVGHFSS